MPEIKTYQGRCRCGAVRYSVQTDLAEPFDCNCSSCVRLGSVMQAVAAEDFVLEAGEDKLTRYTFNSHTIQHLFCSVCGIQSFSRGVGAGGKPMVVISVNCLEDAPPVDHSTAMHWNGRDA